LNISVIIPTYNRAHIIAKSIKSVLNQTITPLEIIIVDDHSTDNTRDIIKSFNHPSIKYVMNTFSKGANGARNTGIMLAKGKYIAFQDSDDLWRPTKLEKQLQLMESNENIDMCFCSLEMTNNKRGIVPKRKVNSNEVQKELIKSNFISTQTIFIKKEVAEENLFDENLKRFQDWDFCIRISKNYKIEHINETLVNVEVQNDSISNNEKLLTSLDQLFNKYPEIRSSCYINKALTQKILLRTNIKKKKWTLSIGNFLGFYYYKFLDILLEKRKKI